LELIAINDEGHFLLKCGEISTEVGMTSIRLLSGLFIDETSPNSRTVRESNEEVTRSSTVHTGLQRYRFSYLFIQVMEQ
jgi:hypothetical protein